MTGALLDIVAIDLCLGCQLLHLVISTSWLQPITLPSGSKHIRYEIAKRPHAWEHSIIASLAVSICHASYTVTKAGTLKAVWSLSCARLQVSIRHAQHLSIPPRSDGQTERANRTILQMLRTTAEDNPADWPNRLPAIVAAYKMTPHSSTGVNPNKAMLGREVLLPCTLIAAHPEADPFK